MFGDMLRQGLSPQIEQQGQPQIPAMGLQGALMTGLMPQGFQMSPQQSDVYGQYNNPMMFLRRQ